MTLKDIINRPSSPEPWSEGEKIPWNDPAFSKRMLTQHLDQHHDRASRRVPIIDRQVDWIHRVILNKRPSRILELCCGPGFYTSRLARLGHSCQGIDFSPASIEYARETAATEALDCDYLLADIRDADWGSGYDFVMLNNGEINPFPAEHAATILTRALAALAPNGTFLLEASRYEEIRDASNSHWYAASDGLFSETPHVLLYHRIWRPAEGVANERYYVINADNAEVSLHGASTQGYTDGDYRDLFRHAGFEGIRFRQTMTGEARQKGQPYLVVTARRPSDTRRRPAATPYDHTRDFQRIRDFLQVTYALYDGPRNWMIERWNFCRYLVLPLHGHVFRTDQITPWETTIGLWEDQDGRIIGVVNSENEEPGEVHFQIHPDHRSLIPAMIEHAENVLADTCDGLRFVKAYVPDVDEELQTALADRGYTRLNREGSWTMRYDLQASPRQMVPAGYRVVSVAEEDDPRRRGRARGRAFGCLAPSDWTPPWVMEQMQEAPDYRRDLDLILKNDQDGAYVSFCTVWFDPANRIGCLEPVGTDPDYRRRGLGRAIVSEGLTRLVALGARWAYVGSSQEFYRAIGFEKRCVSFPWIKYMQ